MTRFLAPLFFTVTTSATAFGNVVLDCQLTDAGQACAYLDYGTFGACLDSVTVEVIPPDRAQVTLTKSHDQNSDREIYNGSYTWDYQFQSLVQIDTDSDGQIRSGRRVPANHLVRGQFPIQSGLGYVSKGIAHFDLNCTAR